MLTYPEPIMPRSTRHLAERAEAERTVDPPLTAERVAAVTRSIRRIANRVRALRAASK
jgi:hypothetical protein